MNPGDIYQKTDKGADEIAHRTHKLPQKLRTMLIMIDGTKPAAVLFEQARRLGVESGFLMELEQGGFIAMTAAAAPPVDDAGYAEPLATHSVADVDQFLAAQQFMSDIILDKLGSLGGYGLMMKLQKAEDLDGLRGLIDAFMLALSNKTSVGEAREITDKVRMMLK